MVKGGAVALAFLGAAGWMLRRNNSSQKQSSDRANQEDAGSRSATADQKN